MFAQHVLVHTAVFLTSRKTLLCMLAARNRPEGRAARALCQRCPGPGPEPARNPPWLPGHTRGVLGAPAQWTGCWLRVLGKSRLRSEDLPGEDVAGGVGRARWHGHVDVPSLGKSALGKQRKAPRRDLEAAAVDVKVTHLPREAHGHRGSGRGSGERGSGAQGGIRQGVPMWAPVASKQGSQGGAQ